MLCICFVQLVKTFGWVPRKLLEWVMRKNGIPKILVRSLMSLYEGMKRKVWIVKVWMHQGSVLSHLLLMLLLLDCYFCKEGCVAVYWWFSLNEWYSWGTWILVQEIKGGFWKLTFGISMWWSLMTLQKMGFLLGRLTHVWSAGWE